MKYKLRYSPAAQKDMDDVWDDVVEVSTNFDIADKYVEEFADKIAAKRIFLNQGYRFITEACSQDSIRSTLRRTRHSTG